MEWFCCHGYSYTSLTEDPLTIWKGPAILFVIIKLECVEYRKNSIGVPFLSGYLQEKRSRGRKAHGFWDALKMR